MPEKESHVLNMRKMAMKDAQRSPPECVRHPHPYQTVFQGRSCMLSMGSLPESTGILLLLVQQGTPRLLGVASVTAPKGVIRKFWHLCMLIQRNSPFP